MNAKMRGLVIYSVGPYEVYVNNRYRSFPGR